MNAAVTVDELKTRILEVVPDATFTTVAAQTIIGLTHARPRPTTVQVWELLDGWNVTDVMWVWSTAEARPVAHLRARQPDSGQQVVVCAVLDDEASDAAMLMDLVVGVPPGARAGWRSRVRDAS